MKNENQIIVRCKQPIEIENPLQCLLGFSFSVGERNILQTVSWSIFGVFNFSMPSKVIIRVIQFMFLSINMFWVLLRAHFKTRLTARAKIILSRAQNTLMPKKIYYCFIITFWPITTTPRSSMSQL